MLNVTIYFIYFKENNGNIGDECAYSVIMGYNCTGVKLR